MNIYYLWQYITIWWYTYVHTSLKQIQGSIFGRPSPDLQLCESLPFGGPAGEAGDGFKGMQLRGADGWRATALQVVRLPLASWLNMGLSENGVYPQL